MTNEPTTILEILIIGGVLGAVGQGIRVAPGLKKAYDAAANQGQTLKENFETSRFFISLFIGLIVGIVSVWGLDGYATIDEFYKTWKTVAEDGKKDALAPVGELLLGLAAAGYAGTDFIEAMIKRRVPGLAGKPKTAKDPFPDPDSATSPPPPPPPAVG